MIQQVSISDSAQVHCVPGTAQQQARSENRQPAKTYLESGVPQKCDTDSYLVHGGIFVLLKIERLEGDGKKASDVLCSLEQH